MNNLKSIFALIIFAVFMTSCQKESLSELKTTTQEASITNRNIPAEGIHYVNESARTLATMQTVEAQAQARTRAIYTIAAGDRYHTTTVGQRNTLDQTNYPNCERTDGSAIFGEYGEPFTGDDMIYYLSVEDSPEAILTHHISTEGETDLDLFVFALNRDGYIQECKAISITPGTGNENIDVQLSSGAYIIVVDAYGAGVAGEYTIEVAQSAVSANPPSLTDIDAVSQVNGQFGSLQNAGEGAWYLHNVIPHFGSEIYNEIARTDNTLSIENVQYLGATTITKTMKLDFQTNIIEITELNETDNTASSSIYTAEIEEVVYEEVTGIDFDKISWINGAFGNFQNTNNGDWYLHHPIPHFGAVTYSEIERTESSITLQNVAYNGSETNTTTMKLDLVNNIAEVTMETVSGNTAASSFYTAIIEEVVLAD